MKKLAVFAMGNKDLEKILIPDGLGCRGRSDSDEWTQFYLPGIESLAARLQPFGIETVLVRFPE